MKIIESQSYKESKKVFSPEETSKIIELYNSGKSFQSIAPMFTIGPEAIKKLLIQNNIRIRTRGEQSKITWQNPVVRDKLLEFHNSDEQKRFQSEKSKKQWQSEEYRDRMNSYYQDPATKEKRKDNATKLWQDEEFKKRRQNEMHDPEFLEMQSRNQKKVWENPVYRAKQEENAKKKWENPTYRAKQEEINQSTELRERKSKNTKNVWKERGGFYNHLSTLPTEKQNAYIKSLVS